MQNQRKTYRGVFDTSKVSPIWKTSPHWCCILHFVPWNIKFHAKVGKGYFQKGEYLADVGSHKQRAHCHIPWLVNLKKQSSPWTWTLRPFSYLLFLLSTIPSLPCQGVVSPRSMEARPHVTCPPPPAPPPLLVPWPPWSLSDSGWLWARSGLGLGVHGGSGCCTDMVLLRWVRLQRKSDFAERPKEPFLRTMRTEGDFLGLARCPNWSVERCAA